jgi:hypothetical protein
LSEILAACIGAMQWLDGGSLRRRLNDGAENCRHH